ncbi:MAG TPA: lipase family protein, partial [Solirubrobacteraceae bacterium]|nr:lipase family protein [Solirubrobacteraceae bacterium]
MSHRHPAGRRRAVLAVAVATLLAVPGAAGARVPHGPPGTAFYRPPSPLPGKGHGAPIRARPMTGAAAVAGARRTERVLYRSIGVSGRPVAVSGAIAIPRGRAPRGGWPVVTWAHGTSGIADACAPSRDTGSGLAHAYNTYISPLVASWLNAGYAVVRTDYEGLGTPGVHPYLVGTSEGRSVLDVVRAARRLHARISRDVVIAGHSQGGHAALWAAALAPRWTPELRVRATVAFAPASHIAEQAALIGALRSPSRVSGLVSLLLRGIDAAEPALRVRSLLGDAALSLYPQTLTRCLPELSGPGSFGGLAPADLLRPRADTGPLVAAIGRRDDPEQLRIRTPLLIQQGAAD